MGSSSQGCGRSQGATSKSSAACRALSLPTRAPMHPLLEATSRWYKEKLLAGSPVLIACLSVAWLLTTAVVVKFSRSARRTTQEGRLLTHLYWSSQYRLGRCGDLLACGWRLHEQLEVPLRLPRCALLPRIRRSQAPRCERVRVLSSPEGEVQAPAYLQRNRRPRSTATSRLAPKFLLSPSLGVDRRPQPRVSRISAISRSQRGGPR